MVDAVLVAAVVEVAVETLVFEIVVVGTTWLPIDNGVGVAVTTLDVV